MRKQISALLISLSICGISYGTTHAASLAEQNETMDRVESQLREQLGSQVSIRRDHRHARLIVRMLPQHTARHRAAGHHVQVGGDFLTKPNPEPVRSEAQKVYDTISSTASSSNVSVSQTTGGWMLKYGGKF